MSVTERLARAIDRLLDWTEQLFIGALSLAALTLGTMQVVLRYVFNTGFEWNEAVFVLCTVSAMLMAGARGVRENAHVRVDVIHMLVGPMTSRMLDLFAYAASLTLCLFYFYCGYLFVGFAKMMDTASPDTGFKDWAVYSIMPVAMLLFSLRYLLKIRAVLLGRETHDAHAGTPLSGSGDAA
ncbi:TRAP transporter small permease [Cereibacter sphaeroides]|nr:TRAP transporter small permease [Cereibacter sphaeroides]